MDVRRINKARRILDSEIVGCYNCQPYDEGRPFWLGPKSDIINVLSGYEYNEEQWSEILSDFRCPNCGTDLTEIYDEVQIKSEIDREIETVFDRIFDKRTVNSLIKFNEHLTKYPYLGSNHALGRRIIKAIKVGEEHLIENEFWYRARLLNKESRIFKSNEMIAPDPKEIFIKEGRYNHTGQSFLYLAQYPETAIKEISNIDDCICAMQKFHISSFSKILDLRQDYRSIDTDMNFLFLAIIYNGYVTKNLDKQISWKPEYFVTRYIADVARLNNYNGIIYSSISHHGDNLVVFDRNNTLIKPVEEPFVFQHPNKKQLEFPDIEI